MKRLIALTALGLVLVQSSFATETPNELQTRLNRIFKPLAKRGVDVSVQVRALDTDQDLYELGSQNTLSPASAIKILTAYVALKKLGPEHTFSTEVLSFGKIANGRLEGDLYLKGGGDPSLVSEKLFLLAQEVHRRGIRSVSGTLHFDSSLFDEELIPEERIDQTSARAYNAPVSGLNLNYNSITMFARPGARAGEPGVVTLESENDFVRIQNKLKTVAASGKEQVTYGRTAALSFNLFEVNGQIPVGTSERRKYFSITRPARYTAHALCSLLGLYGIQVDCSKGQERRTPSGANRVAEVKSAPLREIVLLMNKYSNNFIAEALIKALAIDGGASQGNTRAGLEILSQEARRLGVKLPDGRRIASGSGLTRGDRLSSRDFVTALTRIHGEFDVFPELLVSFPIAGADGTLRSRSVASEMKGLLRAKTGTLDGVRALVGYMSTRSGSLLAFSVLVNGGSSFDEKAFGEALYDAK